MSETPRTDAKEKETEYGSDEAHAHYGWKFARTLERELAAVTRERDEALAELEALQPGIDHLRETCDALERERDEARDRIYDMCGVLSSGCKDNTARAPVEWAEHVLAERDALRAEVERLTRALKLVRDQDQGCGGNVTEAEAWKSAQSIARAALTPAEVTK